MSVLHVQDHVEASQSYVGFFFEGLDMPGYSRVESRDIAALQIPDEVYGFWFFDTDQSKEHINKSRSYFFAEAIIPAEKLHEEIQNPEFLSSMRHALSENKTAYAVRMTGGGYKPAVNNGRDVYINQKKEILWPLEESPIAQEAARLAAIAVREKTRAEQEARAARLRKIAPTPFFRKGG